MVWSDHVEWLDIPERMRGGVARYVERGVPPGGFLQAILKNDLMEAVERADDENVRLLPSYARLLYRECPRGSWGGQDAFDTWVKRGGLRGSDLENASLPERASRRPA